MRKISVLFTFFLFLPLVLLAEDRLEGELSSVSLYSQEMLNDEGRSIGERYYVINHNRHAVKVFIWLTEGVNAENRLLVHPVTVGPKQRGDLGYVQQKDFSRGSSWKFSWEAKPL